MYLIELYQNLGGPRLPGMIGTGFLVCLVIMRAFGKGVLPNIAVLLVAIAEMALAIFAPSPWQSILSIVGAGFTIASMAMWRRWVPASFHMVVILSAVVTVVGAFARPGLAFSLGLLLASIAIAVLVGLAWSVNKAQTYLKSPADPPWSD